MSSCRVVSPLHVIIVTNYDVIQGWSHKSMYMHLEVKYKVLGKVHVHFMLKSPEHVWLAFTGFLHNICTFTLMPLALLPWCQRFYFLSSEAANPHKSRVRGFAAQKIKPLAPGYGSLGYGAVFGRECFYGALWPLCWQSKNIIVLEMFPIAVSLSVWAGQLEWFNIYRYLHCLVIESLHAG